MADQQRSERLQSYTKSLFGAGKPKKGGEEDLEVMAPKSAMADAFLKTVETSRLMGLEKVSLEQVGATIESLRSGTPLNAQQQGLCEAIIIPSKRPVADVLHGKIQHLPEGEFSPLVDDAKIRDRLERAIASVGCILLPNDPRLPYAGTGFVVGKGLLMTNRHVARLFATGLGTKKLAFVGGQSAKFTPGRETLEDEDDAVYQVKRVRMIHPYFDMALLEVPDLALPPLELEPLEPQDSPRQVALVGYPAFDERNPADIQNKTFRGRFSVKRLAPGYMTGRGEFPSFENVLSVAMHDASTLAGNSGSALVDIGSGKVVGLHFAGEYLKSNYAVPAADLALDPRVVDAGVLFSRVPGGGVNPAEKRWGEVEAEEMVGISHSSASMEREGDGGMRITIPIEVRVWVGQVTSKNS